MYVLLLKILILWQANVKIIKVPEFDKNISDDKSEDNASRNEWPLILSHKCQIEVALRDCVEISGNREQRYGELIQSPHVYVR